MKAVMLLIGLLACAGIAWAFVRLLLVGEDKPHQVSRKEANKTLASRTRQLAAARSALTKIAADDSGNPRLDAQIALSEIDTIEFKELES